MSRIVSLPTKKQQAKAKREFLNEPKSWIRLGFLFLLLIIVGWIVMRPKHPTVANTQPQSNSNSQSAVDQGVESQVLPSVTPDDAGVVAGVTDSQPEEPLVKSQLELDKEKETQEIASTQKAVQELLGQSDDLKQLFLSGKEYLNQDKLPEAELVFKRATHIAPEYRDAWYLLGYTYLKEFEQDPKSKTIDSLSNAQKAVITLTKAAAIDPLSETVKNLLDIAKKVTQ